VANMDHGAGGKAELRALLVCDASANSLDYQDFAACHDLTYTCKTDTTCATQLATLPFAWDVNTYGPAPAVDSYGIPTFGAGSNSIDVCVIPTYGGVVGGDLYGPQLQAVLHCQAALKGFAADKCVTGYDAPYMLLYDWAVNQCQTQLNTCYNSPACTGAWEGALGAASSQMALNVTTVAGKMVPTVSNAEDGCILQFATMVLGKNMEAISLGECYKAAAGVDNTICAANNQVEMPCMPYLTYCMDDAEGCWTPWQTTAAELAAKGHELDRRGLPIMADENGVRKEVICDALEQTNKLGNIAITTMSVCIINARGLQPDLKECVDDITAKIENGVQFFFILIISGFLLSMAITGLSCKYCGCACCENPAASKARAAQHES